MDWSRWIVYGLVAIAIVLLLGLMQWQRYSQSRPAGLEFEPAPPEYFPTLDWERLAQQTAELEALGCVQLGDYQGTAEVGVMPPTGIRLFYHRDRDYYVTLTQSLPERGNPSPLYCAIASWLDQDWTIQTTNEPPTPLTPLLQLPRRLWASYPNATPAQLVEAHLQQRQQVASALQVNVRRNISEDEFWVTVKAVAWRQKQRMKRQNSLIAPFKAIYFAARPQFQWLGEYPDAIK